ncbi:MAG: DUF6456 domain-containing protein [Pseudomonadota bacterium]
MSVEEDTEMKPMAGMREGPQACGEATVEDVHSEIEGLARLHHRVAVMVATAARDLGIGHLVCAPDVASYLLHTHCSVSLRGLGRLHGQVPSTALRLVRRVESGREEGGLIDRMLTTCGRLLTANEATLRQAAVRPNAVDLPDVPHALRRIEDAIAEAMAPANFAQETMHAIAERVVMEGSNTSLIRLARARGEKTDAITTRHLRYETALTAQGPKAAIDFALEALPGIAAATDAERAKIAAAGGPRRPVAPKTSKGPAGTPGLDVGEGEAGDSDDIAAARRHARLVAMLHTLSHDDARLLWTRGDARGRVVSTHCQGMPIAEPRTADIETALQLGLIERVDNATLRHVALITPSGRSVCLSTSAGRLGPSRPGLTKFSLVFTYCEGHAFDLAAACAGMRIFYLANMARTGDRDAARTLQRKLVDLPPTIADFLIAAFIEDEPIQALEGRFTLPCRSAKAVLRFGLVALLEAEIDQAERERGQRSA